MPVRAFLKYLLLPARLSGLAFIAALTLGFEVSIWGGLFGVVMGVLLTSWVFQYAYILVEHIANGATEPPVLAMEMLNPAHERRPFIHFLIFFAVYGLMAAIHHWVSPLLADLLAGAALLAVPASIAALAVGDSTLHAVNPRVLWGIARGYGLSYAAILATMVGYAGLLASLAASSLVPQWVATACGLFAWVSVFSLIGGCLYERRDELGHESSKSPERAAAKRRRELERERDRFIDTVFAETRAVKQMSAWPTIERELMEQKYAYEFYDWLLARLVSLDKSLLANRLAQDDVSRALKKDNERVVRVVRARLAADPSFRPISASETRRVIELAGLAGDRATAQCLLKDFAERFPSVVPGKES